MNPYLQISQKWSISHIAPKNLIANSDMSKIVPSPQNVLIQTAVITTHLQYLLYSPTLPLTSCTILPYSPPDLPCHLPYSKPPLTLGGVSLAWIQRRTAKTQC